MSTTAIIIEVLIIGFFAAIWVFLIGLRVSIIEIHSVKTLLAQVGGWATPLFFVAAILFYQLGLLVNLISHKITKLFSQKDLRDQIIAGKDYEYVRATVFQNGSAELLRDLVLYLSFVRLARSGILNFLLIAVVMFSFGGTVASIGVVPLLFSIGCVPLWRAMYRTYYRRMRFAYYVMTDLQTAARASTISATGVRA